MSTAMLFPIIQVDRLRSTTHTMRQEIIRSFSRAAFIVALLSLTLSLGMTGTSMSQATMRTEQLTLVTATGEHKFTIEIAESGADKARGLMFRRTMADDAGMLFPYEPPQEATMWMKNTYLSLDMVFIRADGVVHRIEAGTEPFSEAVITSGGDVAAVLELKAGISQKIGLKPGDRALNAYFKPAK
jgi:uncharacterized protein